MIAILAILRESWLFLRSEMLFKVVMGLNILVIVAYASVGFDDTGVSVFFGLTHFDHDFVRAGTELARTLYLGIYSAFIVNIWLAWAASILALISTSSIFPSFLSEGSVELMLSRPISRTTIFLTKYFGGLIFVMLQVGVFTLGAFLAAGCRISEWDPTIFLAIPLITLFYSYLFCVNVLVGIITRSTLVAILATLLFWFGTFGVRTADDLVNRFAIVNETIMERTSSRVEQLQKEYDDALATGNEKEAADAAYWLTGPEEEYEQAQTTLGQLRIWATTLDTLRIIMPETARTLGLLHRKLEQDKDFTIQDVLSGRAFEEPGSESKPDNFGGSWESAQNKDDNEKLNRRERRRAFNQAEMEATETMIERENAIPAWHIIGKSLIFEFVVLALGIWFFRRRDF